MAESSKLKARFRAERFYEELARLLNRYKPQRYGPYVAGMILDLIDKPRKWRFYPLHFLVHSIEANCAYHKHYRDYPITERRINEIFNHYKGFYDPYYQYALEELEDLELFTLAMANQQFPLQKFPWPTELARSLVLFVGDSALPASAAHFEAKHGFSMQDWIYLSFATSAQVLAKRNPLISPSSFLDSEIKSIPRSAVEPFLDLSSLSPSQVAEGYHSIRSSFPIYLHVFMPSVFFQYPLIAYDDGYYLVVHPTLVFNQALDGLYRTCEELCGETFHSEFADSFERYVGLVLGELAGDNPLYTESEIQAASPGRACDFAVECTDCTVLVECKSVRYSATLLTENAIAKDNSTGKVADGFEQIHLTARRIRNGSLDGVLRNSRKPIFGFVVTFGDLRFANSPQYLSKFIMPRSKLSNQEHWYAPLECEPQVTSVGTLEAMVIVANHQSLSPAELVRAKLSEDYYAAGDWPAYLNSYMDQVGEWMLPALQAPLDRFYALISEGIEQSYKFSR